MAGPPPGHLVSVYCGPTTPAVGEHSGRLAGIEVLLMPWAAFTMFGTPQYELANRAVDPDDGPASDRPAGEATSLVLASDRSARPSNTHELR